MDCELRVVVKEKKFKEAKGFEEVATVACHEQSFQVAENKKLEGKLDYEKV